MQKPNYSRGSKSGSKPFGKKESTKSFGKDSKTKKSFDKSSDERSERNPFDRNAKNSGGYSKKSEDTRAEKKPFNKDSRSKRSFDEYRSGKKSSGKSNDELKEERKPIHRSDKPKIDIDKYRSGKKQFDRSENSETSKKPMNKDEKSKRNFDKSTYRNDKKSFDKENNNKFDMERKFTSNKPAKNRLSGTDEIRLNRFIANAGICSRRDADKLIADGLISINGKVVTELGTKVKPTDMVKYAGEKLSFEKNVYIIMNKPKNYITTLDDPRERNTVIHLLQGKIAERVYPVGRLDRATTGVLILTNDGILTKKLTHPKYGILKVYNVELTKSVQDAHLGQLTTGFELEDGFTKADKAYFDPMDPSHKKIIIELHSGKNRIVRRMMEHMGYEVKTLDRISFAGLTKKNLLRGRWRLLTDTEIGFLMKISSAE